MEAKRRWRWLLASLLVAGFAGGCEGGGSTGKSAGPESPAPRDPASPRPQDPPPASGEAPALDPSIFPEPGETSFTTANERELLSNGAAGGPAGRNARGELDPAAGVADDADGAGEAPPAAPGEPEAQPDPTREIVEADVFKLEGDRLYVLNRYRGLVIIDVSDPDRMRIQGRLPFQAVPVEMYVRDGRAYVVNSDWFQYWQYDTDADPHGFHGSEVMIVDVEDPEHPALLGHLPVEGEVTDTRMVGDVLYTVSKRRPDYWRYNTADWEDRTWIVSLNVADPENIREIDRITFQGMSTLIHVAHHAIFVAAWDPNYYLTDPLNEQETLVTYVDISDPEGALRERGSVYIPGRIADKFKMDWHEGALRVFSQRWREDANITLHVVETGRPDELDIDATLELDGLRQSGLRATRFDGPRAFAMSARWESNRVVQELHTLDLSDPLNPERAAKKRIDLDITHFEVHGDRLLALGSNRQRWRDNRVALALFDVSDLAEPRELAMERLGEGYSSSEANHDYKALKVYRDLGLILVPLRYWVPGNHGRSRWFEGVQIVDWVDDTLDERGRAEVVGGVRRAFPVGERLVAVGEMAISTLDATNRDRPRVTKTLHLVHRVHDIFEVGGLQAQLVTDVYEDQVVLEVREFGPDDDAPPIARVELPYQWAPYAFLDGDVLHLIGFEDDGKQTIRNVDLSDPREPRLRGLLRLEAEMERIHNQGQGFYARYWSPHAGLPLRNQILPVTVRRIVSGPSGRRDFQSELRFLDLRDPDAPRFAEGAVPMNDYPFVNKVTHGNVLYSTHVEEAKTEDGGSLLYHVRSFVDRVDVTDPDRPVQLPSVNVPGYLVDVSADGNVWFTVDYQWDDFGRRRNSLNVLRLVAEDTAELVTVLPVPDQIHRAVFRPSGEGESMAIWLTAHKYPWWGVRGDTVESRQPYTVLSRWIFDDAGAVAAQTEATLAGYHFDLLDVEGRRAYLASRFPTGLLVLDVSDPAAPRATHAARTIGYLGRIVVHDDHAYAPMDMFGVHRYRVVDAAPRE